MDFSICRICFVKVDDNNSFLLTNFDGILSFITSLKITPNDGLPQFICKPCGEKARDAFNFRILCEESDMYLKCNEILGIDPVHKPFTSITDKIREQLKCGSCDMIFYYKKPLIKHEQQHQKGFECKDCGKNYPTAKHLAIHIQVKKRKGSHVCQTCGKAYTMPENLKRHERVHTGIRPFSCQVCGKSFTQSNVLKNHMISHSSEKKFLCSYCGHKYAHETSLQIHITRIHSTKQYPCDACGKIFKGLSDVKVHQSIHFRDKKFVCTECGKTFTKSCNLKVHERIHSGHKPFVCQICQKSFIQKHVLHKHLETTHSVPRTG